MLDTAHLTAFIATARPDLARAFYSETLGFPLRSEDDFALSFDANGVELRVQKVAAVTPHSYTALGWNVPDVRSTVTKLAARGVTFERYPFLEQDSAGIWTAPSGARIAWFKDPDDNLLSIAEYSAS